jgi:hypothetical protein
MNAADLGTACDAHFPGDFPAVFPWLVQETRGSLRAFYWCPVLGCGRKWKCRWDSSASGWPISREAAA